MSVGRVCRGNREVPARTQKEGGTWGKHGFPHGSEPKASDAHSGMPASIQLRNVATCSDGHLLSHGIDPSATRS